jgi:uncharacterized protein (TIGR03084 family)
MSGRYRDAMTAASEVFADLAAEQDALAAMLGRLGDADWAEPSAARGWSVSDVVLHLAQTEELVPATVNGVMSGLRGSGPAGEVPSMDEAADQAVAAERGQPPEAVFARWQSARREALTALRGCAPDRKLPWAVAPLSPVTLATTRLAEPWAHALDIADGLGLDYPDTSRLRHVAWLAVRTLPYAFAVAALPARAVRAELAAPDGATWRFGAGEADGVITGSAGAFCRVAAQRLAPGDSGLTATGPGAAKALRVLRTYAA